MSIQTDLSVSPYFDDYKIEDDYYKVLFRPSVPVQVREMNQLQTILQKQIEKFGDHVFKRGTRIEGCQITDHFSIPFVKLKDNTTSSTSANTSTYEGLLVRNSTGLLSRVIASNTGFESQDPDLKTIYLDYLNEGDSGEEREYANGQVLTVFNGDKRLYSITIDNPSVNFSNNDNVVILSSIEIQNTAGGTAFSNGGFSVGDLITQETTLAEAVVTGVNTTANSAATVLQIRPVRSQLVNGGNVASWSFGTDYLITSNTSGANAYLTGFVGNGATATLSATEALGVTQVEVTNGGSNYYIEPYVTVSSATANTSEIESLKLTANPFLANVVVATVTNSVGSAYGVSTTAGTVYQKGHFLRSDQQFLIIDKYANTPNDLAIGYETIESISNSSIDTSLVDNASGFLNYNAPGANRLKLTPRLVSKTTTEAEQDPNFLALVKYSAGKAYMLEPSVAYNGVGEELARRTFEESGNYVLDRFNMTTKSTLSIANSDTHFTYVVDPGHAYVNGFRVKTQRDYAINVEKSLETEEFANTSYDIIYGNYVLVKEFAGLHAFSEGKQIDLLSSAVEYLTDHPSDEISTAVGGRSSIGKARVRSVLYHGGAEQGAPEAVYRVYLFDIKMNPGSNFASVRSVYANNASGLDGVGDVVLESVAGQTARAVLQLKDKNSLLIDTEMALAEASNFQYLYRTTQTGLQANTAGFFTAESKVNSTWPYSNVLSSFEENELIVLPESDMVDTTLISSSTITDVSPLKGTLTGSGFVSGLDAGDYIYMNGSIARVTNILSDTQLYYQPSDALGTEGATGNVYRCYPKGIPVPLYARQFAAAQVSGNTLTVNLDINIGSPVNVTLISNQRLTDNSVAKSASRNVFVKVDCSNNVAGSSGPWCMGFSDVIRLRNVYLGTDTSAQNVTREFYIDHNQNENYYDLGYLYLKPNSTLSLSGSDDLLIEFDYTTHNKEGVKSVSSYTINDQLPLSRLETEVNTLEIPEFNSKSGNYFDLRECLDFRPRSANTVAAVTDPASAPVNPPEASEESRFVGPDLLFPVPEGDLFCDLVAYRSRQDIIILNSEGDFEILKDADRPRIKTPNQMTLYESRIPPYPSLPSNLSFDVAEILDTKMASESYNAKRRDRYTIKTSSVEEQVPGYTMEQINQLEERISALEYYINLSELEDEVKNKVMPSSIDSTIERFKFGFFVDNFIDLSLTNVDSPEISSTIYEGLMYPSRRQYNLDMVLSEDSSASYTDNFTARYNYNRKKLVGQPRATVGPVLIASPDPAPEPTPPPATVPDPTPVQTPDPVPVPPPPPTTTPPAPTVPVEPPPIVSNTSVFVSNKNTRYSTRSKEEYEETIFTLSSNSESDSITIELDFNLYSGKDRFEIYQSTNKTSGYRLVATNTQLSPSNLTTERKRQLQNFNLKPTLQSSTFANRWLKDRDYEYESKGPDNKYWLKNVGRLSFEYNLTNGRYIKIRVIKGSPNHSYYITFPTDAERYVIKDPTPKVSIPKQIHAPVVIKPFDRVKPTITVDVGQNRKSPITVWKPSFTPIPSLPTKISKSFTNISSYNKPTKNVAVKAPPKTPTAKGFGSVSDMIFRNRMELK